MILAIVTETWFADGSRLELETENLLLGHGLRLQTLNRPPLVSGVSYGGVAIITKENCTRSTIMKFRNPEKFEVLPTCLTIQDLRQKLFVIAAYIPPNYPVPRGKMCLTHISDLVLQIKNTNPDPLIILAGDFNQWDIGAALLEFSDMEEVSTPPTRGDRHIDKIFTNWGNLIEESGCIPPLEAVSPEGHRTHSDHNIQYVVSRLPKKEPARWNTVTFRHYTPRGEADFLSELSHTDWSNLLAMNGPNAKTDLFHSLIEDLTSRHFPLKTVKQKDNDLPWFDNKARKLTKRKAAIYKSEGASSRWERERDRLESYLEKRRLKYLERQRERFTGPTASANFHRNVRAFGTADRPKNFDVRDLFPGLTDVEVADKVAEYFNAISSEFKPLQPHEIPATYHRQLDFLSDDQVEKMILGAKKPKSTVRGDIPPGLVNRAVKSIRVPVASIFNSIIATNVWPISWKREYVTVIPKKSLPSGLGDLRNISCTPLLSKIFEGHILSRIHEEISLKPNQYGGVKKCSTAHMVVELLQEMCENAEDYRSATILTAIDYSKAFNRLSFQHCLEAFRRKGASTPIIRIIASFLTNRTMSVRVGQEWSSPLEVNGGCPQGSVLGVDLFNTTTDDLEDQFLDHERERLRLPLAASPVTPPHGGRQPRVPLTFSTPDGTNRMPDFDPVSPIGAGAFAQGTEGPYKPSLPTRNHQPVLVDPPVDVGVGTQVLEVKMTKVFKYIDDNIICEKLNLGPVPIVPGSPPTKTRLACSTQNAFRMMTGNAGAKGMVVNTSKTNMLCVSDALNYRPNSYFDDGGGDRVESTGSMKVLGFHFSDRPTVQLHVDETVKKIRRKYYSLRHLARYGMSQSELVEVYKSTIRPIADYCAPAYHSMVNDVQDQKLESAQTGALRAIFGYGLSARRLRQAANVQTLRERRIEQTDKFARKAAASQRFSHWFPKNTARRSGRNSEVYVEKFAKCDRLMNSPLYYMRRRLNGKEGKSYGLRNQQYRENFNLN